MVLNLDVDQRLEKYYLSTEKVQTSAKRLTPHLSKIQEKDFLAKFHINYSMGYSNT